MTAPCEDWTHDLQISNVDYETDALPTALTRQLQRLPEAYHGLHLRQVIRTHTLIAPYNEEALSLSGYV